MRRDIQAIVAASVIVGAMITLSLLTFFWTNFPMPMIKSVTLGGIIERIGSLEDLKIGNTVINLIFWYLVVYRVLDMRKK